MDTNGNMDNTQLYAVYMQKYMLDVAMPVMAIVPKWTFLF